MKTKAELQSRVWQLEACLRDLLTAIHAAKRGDEPRPESNASLLLWFCDKLNDHDLMYDGPLTTNSRDFDEEREAIREYLTVNGGPH